jgi:hypothetical protein
MRGKRRYEGDSTTGTLILRIERLLLGEDLIRLELWVPPSTHSPGYYPLLPETEIAWDYDHREMVADCSYEH